MKPETCGHPDHDAAAFAVQTACNVLCRMGNAPVRLEMTGYHERAGDRVSGIFWPDPSCQEVQVFRCRSRAVSSPANLRPWRASGHKAILLGGLMHREKLIARHHTTISRFRPFRAAHFMTHGACNSRAKSGARRRGGFCGSADATHAPDGLKRAVSIGAWKRGCYRTRNRSSVSLIGRRLMRPPTDRHRGRGF
jgi:hypothetical protein